MKALVPAGLTVALLAAGLTASAQVGAPTPSEGQKDARATDAKGNLRVPLDYRSRYQAFGSWAVSGNGAGPKETHFVYSSPGTLDALRKTGRFPEGAVLVEEVFLAATNGTTGHASTLKGRFVVVMDSRCRHSGNPLWGLAWFEADKPYGGA